MTDSDETLRIETPENVAFGYEVAGIGSRFLAAMVDTIIITLIQVVIMLALFAVLYGVSETVLEEGNNNMAIWIMAIGGLFLFFLYWGYYIFFEMSWNGQSPGKRWAGLRVIRADGTPITLAESIIRNLVRLVDLLPYFYGVGVVTMFIDGRSRRLGDLAAGTLVVRDQSSITLDSLKAAPIRHTLQSIPLSTPEYPVQLLTPSDLQIAEDFLQRREGLANRSSLARRIASALHKRMGLPDAPMQLWEAEQSIERIVQASKAKPSE